MIKIVFFDCDGVLTKDKGDMLTTCRYVSDKIGLPLENVINAYENSFDIYAYLTGKISEEEAWKAFYEKIISEYDVDANYAVFMELRRKAFASTEFDNRMMDIVQGVKSNGKAVGIITDNPVERMNLLIEKYSLNDIFSPIVVSADVHSTKREEEIFQIALKNAGVYASEAFFIDNKDSNLIVPKKMGLVTSLFDDAKRDYDGLCKQLSDYDLIKS